FVLDIWRPCTILGDHPIHFFRITAARLFGHLFLKVDQAFLILPAGRVADRGENAQPGAIASADILGALAKRQVAADFIAAGRSWPTDRGLAMRPPRTIGTFRLVFGSRFDIRGRLLVW